MTSETVMIDVMESRAKRREERRGFFTEMGGKALAGGVAAIATSSASAQTAAPTDADILNFALNLEYLEAQFYSFAVFGTGLEANLLTGTGTQGAVTGGRKVTFSDPVVSRYAREIVQDEIAHVKFLRGALMSGTVSQPEIDIGTGQNAAGQNRPFTAAAVAAGLPATFDPYLDDNSFLLGAYIFEDVGVTAYKGAAPLITSKVFLEAAAGILAVEAYHASLIRTTLYGKGVETPSLRTAADAISNARDSLDGTSDLDQGISPVGGASNIVPLDANGLAFSRSGGQVLNIVYLNNKAVDRGGFFPAGVNGNIKTSAAN